MSKYDNIFNDVENNATASRAGVFGDTDSIDADDIQLEEETTDDEQYKHGLELIKSFSMKPKEIKDYLDRFVIKQDEAKKSLAVAVCDHYNRIKRSISEADFADREFIKQNLIILGPTGVGKTYLIKTLAKLIGVPFVKADATKFSATGYVGHDVEDLVRNLVKMADGNTEIAKYGIIYIDEIDKIATRSSDGQRDVSGRGVQINLLKLMEDSDINLISQTDVLGQMEAAMNMMNHQKPKKKTINTRNILFIVSGAFETLPTIIQKRLGATKIGFTEGELIAPEEAFKNATTADFIKFGFEPEFIGRLPIRVQCDKLEVEDLARIITIAENSILGQYCDDFKGYGIDFKLTDDAVQNIAELAYLQSTGARGLMTVFDRILRHFKYELPSTAVNEFTLGVKDVADPEIALERVLLAAKCSLVDQKLQQLIEEFPNNNKCRLSMTKAVSKSINKFLIDGGAVDVDQLEHLLSSAVNYINCKSIKPIKRIKITAAMLKDPSVEVDKLVCEYIESVK